MTLTRAVERELFAEYRRTGDPRIEARLVESQRGLTEQLARPYKLRGIEWADLYQEALVGLLHAVRRFDPERGVRLSTYAAHWIRAYAIRYTMRNLRLVRLGTTQAQRRIFFRLHRLRARFEAAGVEPTTERIAHILGVDEKCVRETGQRLEARELSLDARLRADGRGALVDDLTADLAPADEALAASEMASAFVDERERYRRSLEPRLRELFDARFSSEEQPTLSEMGKRLGVSRERARQLEQKMLIALRGRVERRLAA